MKKKILVTMLCMVTALSVLTGCGDSGTTKKTGGTEAVVSEPNTEVSTETEEETEEKKVSELNYVEDIDVGNIRLMILPTSRSDKETASHTSDGRYTEDIYGEDVALAIHRWGYSVEEYRPIVNYVDVDGEQWYEIIFDISGIIANTDEPDNFEEVVSFREAGLEKVVLKVSPDYTKFYFDDTLFEFPQERWDILHENSINDCIDYNKMVESGEWEGEVVVIPEWDENNVLVNYPECRWCRNDIEEEIYWGED